MAILVFFIALPFAIGICWVAGYAFRIAVLKHDLDKGNRYLQFVFTVAIGIFIFLITSSIFKKLGWLGGDDIYYR